LNIEQIGIKSASADAELISACWQLFNNLGLKNIQLHINTVGSIESRKEINNILFKYFGTKRNQLCEDCRQRLNKNPIRIFDCKLKSCQSVIDEAPQIIDHIDSKSKKHFYELLEYLDELAIPYIFNPKLVRGLEYYTNTVFEFIPEDSLQAIGGGGRYDDLYQSLGAESTPAVGIALGVERIIQAMATSKIKIKPTILTKPDIYLIQLGSSAKKKCFRLLYELRSQKFKVSSSLNNKSISSQLKKANKQQARMAVIIGEKEAIDNTVIIRDMQSGMQDVIDSDKAINEISLRLGL
jgi:histidyl-tRNA synthetase